MSKELDNKLLKILKQICENTYDRPTPFDEKALENLTESSVFDVSHSLNNLQRNGLIRIHIGLSGESSRVELLKTTS